MRAHSAVTVPRFQRAARFTAIVALAALGQAFPSVSSAQACIASGTDAAIQAALTGAGAVVQLCPGAVFNLSNPVRFTAPNQVLQTQGLPTGNTRAILRLAASGLTNAIHGNGQSGITVQNIEVDGNIGTLGRLGGDALMFMGDQGGNQTIQNNFIHDTRSWSMLHMREGTVVNGIPSCQNGRIVDNLIMSAGTNVPAGTWADGISLACGTTLVQGNTIIDATDGGIVIFGAPGSTIQNNTIIAQSRVMLGAINLVDFAPVGGNYAGTRVLNNVIDARGALIKIGMASGPGTWFCEPDTAVNRGATISGNTLQGTHMGYGFAVRGVAQWTITGNTDNSTHSGVAGSMCGGGVQNPQAPAGFQFYAPATQATLQPQFQAVTGNFWGLLSISENVGAAPLVYAQRNSLSYAPVAVGQASTPQSVTITNTGPGTANIAGVIISGDYTQTNNCSSLVTGSSCVAYVTFRPSATGTRSGTLTVNSNAGNGPSTVSLAGSGDTGGPVGAIATNPASLTFAATAVGGTSAVQGVTVSNTGSAAATVSAVSASGDFTQTNNCALLTAGASCTVSVTFRPLASGARNGSLTITSNASNSPNMVSLSGLGGSVASSNIALGKLTTASSFQQNFVPANATDGNANTYWESANNAFPQWLQVDIGASMPLDRVVLKLPPATAWATRSQTLTVQTSDSGATFAIIVGPRDCVFDPALGNTCTIALPAGTSARFVRLNFTANTGWPAGQVSEFEVWNAVTGTATLAASPTTVAFGNQVINTTSAVRPVTITNTGTAPASVSGVAAGGEFLQTHNCGTLAPNAFCTVNVTFRPTTVGAKAGTLTVNSNASNPSLGVALSGTGTNVTATLAANPTSLAFGDQTVNTTSAIRIITITNTGAAAATVSGVTVGAEFLQTHNCATLAAGASCTVNVTFRPTTPGAKAGTLTVNSNASNPSLGVALSGTGINATVTLTANPTSLAFGNQLVNTSAVRTVTITNTGNASGTVSGVTAAAQFSQTNNCAVLAAGATCTVSVTFTPTAAGLQTGALTVNSNASNPSLGVGLSGTGVSITTDLAAGRPATSLSVQQGFVASNLTDVNQASYWESQNNAFTPSQWVQVDLGSAMTVGRVVLKLPTNWGTRNQTLSVLGSTNNTNWSTLTGSASRTFSPTANTVEITFTASSQRYIRIDITANTGWPAGQLSSLEVYAQ